MAALFQFALAPYFVEVYCLFIILVFSATLIRWLRESRTLKKKLEKAVHDLRRLGRGGEFAHKFQGYGDKIARDFPQLWPRYRDTLITPGERAVTGQRQGESAPMSTAGASQYINDTTVLGSHLPVHVYSAVPNILTGLGILGTFLGLAGGIGQATAGITSTDTSTVRDALSVLLDGAALAFVTSIVGVALSIVFLVVMRRQLGSISRLTGRWAARLDRLVKLRTPAQIAAQQLREAKKASASLQNFATDLAVAIGQQTGPHLEELLTELRAIRADRATDSGKLIRDAMEDFAQALSKQTGNQFDTLATTVTDLNSSLAASARRFEETQESVNSTVKALVAEMETSMHKSASTMSLTVGRTLAEATGAVGQASHDFANQLNSATSEALAKMDHKLTAVTSALAQAGTSAAGDISESSAGLQAAVQQLARSTAQSERVLDHVTRFAEEFDRLHAAMGKTGEQIVAVAAPLQRASATIQESVNRTVGVLEGTQGLVDRIENSTQSLETHNRSLAEVWNQYQERFEDIDRSLAQVFEKLSESLASYCHQVTEFAKTLDATAGEAIEKLSAATGELGGTVEDLIDAIADE